jgi:hypothetical protein
VYGLGHRSLRENCLPILERRHGLRRHHGRPSRQICMFACSCSSNLHRINTLKKKKITRYYPCMRALATATCEGRLTRSSIASDTRLASILLMAPLWTVCWESMRSAQVAIYRPKHVKYESWERRRRRVYFTGRVAARPDDHAARGKRAEGDAAEAVVVLRHIYQVRHINFST